MAACSSEPASTESRSRAVGDPAFATDPDGVAFLAVSAGPVDGSDAPPVFLRRSGFGMLTAAYGSQFRIPQHACAGAATTPVDAARCFLDAFGLSFGLSSLHAELTAGPLRATPEGIQVVRFGQVHLTHPVFGGHIDVVLDPGLNVIGAFSTLALPLVAPSPVQVDDALASHQPTAAWDSVAKAFDTWDIELRSSHALLWPRPGDDGYTAVPALAETYHSPSDDRLIFAVVQADTAEVLEVRSHTAELANRVMHGFAIHDQMDEHSFHLECTQDSECLVYGQTWHCSDHFEPNRCVARCTSHADCQDFHGYYCFPIGDNPDLGGYCFWRPPSPAPEQARFRVYGTVGDWYNPTLADHKAYARIKESLDETVSWHDDPCGVVNGYDGQNSDYVVNIHSQCYGCDTCENNGCPCDREYSACGGIVGNVNFGQPWISLRYWRDMWSTQAFSYRANADFVMGHEWGHVLVGAAYQWQGTWPPGCVKELTADLFGKLFSLHRHGKGDPWARCGGFPSDNWNDDRSGLNPGCWSNYLKSYAYRSRFDLLRCSGQTINHGTGCLYHTDCPAYQECEGAKPNENPPIVGQCVEKPDLYNARYPGNRLARILAEGSGVFAADGHDEDLGIPNSPIGLALAARVISDANRSLGASTDLDYWMVQMKFWASMKGVWQEMVSALGAAGFFPISTSLSSDVALYGPVSHWWTGYQADQQKGFWAYKRTDGYIAVLYRENGVDKEERIRSDTQHRPTLVGYKDYLHLFHVSPLTGQVRVHILHKTGGRWTGPYDVDPGVGYIRPNGAFHATVWQDRLYLVFGNARENDYLYLAWCRHSTGCQHSGWNDFGGGAYSKRLLTIQVLPGPSAVGTTQVNGRPWDEENLWILFANQANGGQLLLARVGASDSTQEIKAMPAWYPSGKTDAPVGIAAKASAFDGTCYRDGVPYRCDRMYLYLIWKDAAREGIYTSVYQDDLTSRFTFPQPTFYSTRQDMGVSFGTGALPGDNINGVFSHAADRAPFQFTVIGKY